MIEKYDKKYIPIQKQYLSEEKPIEKADMVKQNNDFINPKIVFHRKTAD